MSGFFFCCFPVQQRDKNGGRELIRFFFLLPFLISFHRRTTTTTPLTFFLLPEKKRFHLRRRDLFFCFPQAQYVTFARSLSRTKKRGKNRSCNVALERDAYQSIPAQQEVPLPLLADIFPVSFPISHCLAVSLCGISSGNVRNVFYFHVQ